MVSRWLWPGNGTFLEVACMVVTWWIVGFLHSVFIHCANDFPCFSCDQNKRSYHRSRWWIYQTKYKKLLTFSWRPPKRIIEHPIEYHQIEFWHEILPTSTPVIFPPLFFAPLSSWQPLYTWSNMHWYARWLHSAWFCIDLSNIWF